MTEPMFEITSYNAKTKKRYTRRGTSSIESDHRGLDELIGNHAGVGLCDRKTSTHFELLNEKKRLNRLGGEDYGTHRTETLCLLNSMASSAGCADDKLPHPGLSVPRLPPRNQREHFGFQCISAMTDKEFWDRHHTSQASRDSTAPDTDNNGNEEEDVDPEEGAPPLDEVLADLDAADVEDSEDPEAEAKADAIETAVARITPLIRPYESTSKAFERLTNQQPWCPFHSGSTEPSDVHKEEFAVFDTMQSRFKRGVGPRAKHGYQEFANEWNMEVANRCLRMIDGEDDVILIRRKSAMQLHEHFDRMEEKNRMAVTADSATDKANRLDLREAMRSTRDGTVVAAIPTATNVQHPSLGVVPFGMPAPLNPEILQGAVLHQPQRVMEANAAVGRPWQLQVFSPTQNVLVGYRKKAWCVTCGFRKASHMQEESFGYKCKREHCARCGWMKECHRESNFLMGPHCMNPVKFDSPHSQWYDYSQWHDVKTSQVGITQGKKDNNYSCYLFAVSHSSVLSPA